MRVLFFSIFHNNNIHTPSSLKPLQLSERRAVHNRKQFIALVAVKFDQANDNGYTNIDDCITKDQVSARAKW
jgi:hypothetical protein